MARKLRVALLVVIALSFFAAGASPVRKQLVSIDLQEADIRTVLQTFADLGEVNIVASQKVAGKVSVRLRDILWEQAFNTVLRVHGLAAVEKEGIIGVMTMEEMEAQERVVSLETRVFRINYAKAEKIESVVVGMLSERGRSKVDQRTNSLIITDVPNNFPQLTKLIEQIDTLTPQVMIQAKLVEVDFKAAREMGIDWSAGNLDVPMTDTHLGGRVSVPAGAPTTTLTFGKLLDSVKLDAMLSMLEAENKANILSQPSVAVMDNEEAMILSGKKIPVIMLDMAGNKIIKFYDVALKLIVTPHINPENKILLELHPEVSDLSSEATVAGGVIILTSQVETKLMVNDGETAVIGGVIRSKESNVMKGVPFISHIPLLGRLFKYTSKSTDKTELMVFVTPSIMPVE